MAIHVKGLVHNLCLNYQMHTTTNQIKTIHIRWLVKDVNVIHNFKNNFYCEELFTRVDHSIDVIIKKSQLEKFLYQ